MNSEDSRLEKLLKERKQIENRIKQIQAKKNSQKRKLDTRRKILFGVMFEKLVVEGRIKDETIAQLINEHLKTERHQNLVRSYLASLLRADSFPSEKPLVPERGRGQRLGISRSKGLSDFIESVKSESPTD